MKPNTAPAADSWKPSVRVCALLVVLCVLCGTLAVVFGHKKNELQDELDKMQRLQGNRTASSDRFDRHQDADSSGKESEQVFRLVNQLSQKEAAISELRQRMIALQEGKVPETKLSQNTLPKSVRSSRQPKPPVHPPVPVRIPRKEVVRSPQPAAAPVYRNLSVQESFLRSLDVAAMPVSEQETHSELLKHLEALRRHVDTINRNRGADSSGELRAALAREEQNVDRLMRQERLALFSNVGRELGYDDESSQLFAEHIDRIGAMTTLEQPSQSVTTPEPMPPEPPVTEDSGAGEPPSDQ